MKFWSWSESKYFISSLNAKLQRRKQLASGKFWNWF